MRERMQVRERRFAPFVRLEVQASMPLDLTEFLVHELSLTLEQDVYRVPQVLDLEQLARTTRCARSSGHDSWRSVCVVLLRAAGARLRAAGGYNAVRTPLWPPDPPHPG